MNAIIYQLASDINDHVDTQHLQATLYAGSERLGQHLRPTQLLLDLLDGLHQIDLGNGHGNVHPVDITGLTRITVEVR